jgi:hypothetical protein
MAYDQLKLYNEALLLAGERSLTSLSEAHETRYRLDEEYTDAQAVTFCLELAQPAFARKTTRLNSPAAHTTMAWSHSYPSNYVAFIGLYTDAALSKPVSRYVIEGSKIICDHSDVYLRFTSSEYAISAWDISFAKVVSSYLALKIATRISKEEYEKLKARHDEDLQKCIAIAARTEATPRPLKDGSTLSNDWINIYNDALMIMGLEPLTSTSDDSNRRYRLSLALSTGIVEELMEDLSWQFGQTTELLAYDSGIDPAWGYPYAFEKPSALHRIDGLYVDEHQQVPLRQYHDEGDYFYAGVTEIYLVYISTTFLTTPSNWPTYFKKLVAAKMAKDAAPSLRNEGADVENANKIFDERDSSSKSIDAMQSPPKVLGSGSWVGARNRGGNRGRP